MGKWEYIFHKRILLEGVVTDKLAENKGFDAFRAFCDALFEYVVGFYIGHFGCIAILHWS
jgi:hypothetical protein